MSKEKPQQSPTIEKQEISFTAALQREGIIKKEDIIKKTYAEAVQSDKNKKLVVTEPDPDSSEWEIIPQEPKTNILSKAASLFPAFR